jgi:hypothetical protein
VEQRRQLRIRVLLSNADQRTGGGRVFRILKRVFGFDKVRYRGIAKRDALDALTMGRGKNGASQNTVKGLRHKRRHKSVAAFSTPTVCH